MPESREIIQLHFGQAGIQMGNAVWETMVTEHGIQSNGTKDHDNRLADNFENAVHTIFHHVPSGHYVPRALIVDTESSVVDEIRSGYYRGLFHPDMLLSGVDDAANNFARGYYSLGKRMLSSLLERVRYIIESCDNFKGFVSYTSSGGGTGSGLYSLFFERIILEYSGKFCIGFLVLPGNVMSDSIVEPYNNVLRISQATEETDINVLIDNQSLYKICSDKLETYKPTYITLNRLLAPIFSTITAPFRFGGPMTGDLSDMTTNLVPFPKINFPSLSYSPFLSSQNCDHSLLTTQNLTNDVFQYDHSLLNLDIKKHKIMASVIIYRGYHNEGHITKTINTLRKDDTFNWVDWCPTGFKVVQSSFPPIQFFPAQPDKSVLMLCNNSGVIRHFEQITNKFRVLYSKRCFIHWYIGEGMEYDELTNAYNQVAHLRNVYEDVCTIEKTTKHELDAMEKALFVDLMTENRIVNEKKDELKQSPPIQVDKTLVQELSRESTSYITPKKSINAESNTSKTIQNKNENKDQDIDSTSYITPKKSINAETTTTKTIQNTVEDKDLNSPKRSEVVVDNGYANDPNSLFLEKRMSEDFMLSNKAKAILMETITSLTPEMKQRMLGFTNID